MPVPGPGYSITVRVEAPPSSGAAGDLTSAVGRVGGVITAFDVVESHTDRVVVDITCNAMSANHARDIADTLGALPGVDVRKVSDRTFLMHLGGKIEVTAKVALRNRDDLSRAYTPGVARICTAIAENPDDARRLTIAGGADSTEIAVSFTRSQPPPDGEIITLTYRMARTPRGWRVHDVRFPEGGSLVALLSAQ